MKLNKTIKKFLAVTLSLAMVLTSMVISDVTTKAEGEFEITDIRWNLIDGVKVFDVDFNSASGDKATDPYHYCIYLDQIDSDHSAINYSLEWNWKDNFQYLGENATFNNNFTFDKVFTTAADFKANGKTGSYLAEGTHTVYIVAYATVEDAKADQNPVNTASKTFDVPAEVETTTEAPITTAADADTVVPVEILGATKDANNGITLNWNHPEGMDEYTQEFYLGTTDEVVEDENHWAKNGTANWVWGSIKGRKGIDNVVTTKDGSINVNNGGDYVVRVVYKDADGKVAARGTTDPIHFDKYSNTDMNLFQERNEDLKVFLKWKKVTGAATYALYDAEGTEVKNNINADWVDVILPAYDTDYTYTVKAFDNDGNEMEVTNNTAVAKVNNPDATTEAPETTTEAPETTTEAAETTTKAPVTTQAPTTTKKPAKNVLKKTKITKATRKSVKAKKIKLTFKRVKNAKKYKVEVSTSKKFKKALVRKTVKKVSVTITGKALKNKKKLYVRVRAVGAKKWAVKQVKIKK